MGKPPFVLSLPLSTLITPTLNTGTIFSEKHGVPELDGDEMLKLCIEMELLI